MSLLMNGQSLYQFVNLIPYNQVCIYKFGIVIKQECLPGEPACVPKMKEDRSSADKRLAISAKGRWEIGFELREKLLFPAHPFHKWSCIPWKNASGKINWQIQL